MKETILYTILPIITYIYFGGWLFFIKPIIHACTLFDLGTLTGMDIFWTIVQCIVISPVIGFVASLVVLFVSCLIDVIIETIQGK